MGRISEATGEGRALLKTGLFSTHSGVAQLSNFSRMFTAEKRKSDPTTTRQRNYREADYAVAAESTVGRIVSTIGRPEGATPYFSTKVTSWDHTRVRVMIDNTHLVVLHGTGRDMIPVPEMAAFGVLLGMASA